MSTTQIRIAGTGSFLILIFVSGIWLSNSGKPLNGIIFNTHKFIALGAVGFLAVTIYQINKQAALNPTEIIMSVVTGLLFVGTMISGGLLSIEEPMPAFVLTLHQVLPFVTALSTAITLYLLLSRK